MAIIARDMIKTFPQASTIIHYRLSGLKASKPRVFKVFLKHSGLSADYATKALANTYIINKKEPIPTITLEPPRNRISGWAYFPGAGHDIWLALRFVKAIEEAFHENHSAQFIKDTFAKTGPDVITSLPYGELAQKRTDDHRKAKLFLESVLLHELVHWGRDRSLLPPGPNEPLSNDPNRVSKERGWMFVKEAYGDYLTPDKL